MLPNGVSKPVEQEQPQAPYIKLDILLRVTQYHREKWIQEEDEILTNKKYVALHHAWMDDWESWMTKQAQRDWWIYGNHGWTRSRFKNFMFKIAGCAELLQFFLYVPHTYQNFRIFREVFEAESVWSRGMERNEILMMAVQQVWETRM